MQRHAESAALHNNVALLHAQSESNITEPKIYFSKEKTFIELIIKYPKVKGKLPLITKLLKIKRYKHFYNFGLNVLKKEGFSPDLIHCNVMNPVGLVASLWKKKLNIPYIITEHWTGFLSSDGRYKKNPLLKLSLPKIANGAEKVLPVSLDLKKALTKHKLGKTYKIVRNVVNTNKFFPQQKVKNKFLVVADLDNAQKNITGIVNAFKAFSDTYPSMELAIAGGGKDEDLIKSHINQLQISQKVKLYGRLNAEALNNLLAESYASVLFSNYENLPCVIVEAFSAGIPFISTKVGGTAEIIDSKKGILIPPKDEDALVKAMHKAVKTNWDKNAIRDYAIQTFGIDKIGEELNCIYNQILGN